METGRDIEELLPAYVNGTLAPIDRERVERALAADPLLRQELHFTNLLAERVRQREVGHSPGALGWQRLRREIAGETTKTKQPSWPLAVAAAAVLVALVQGALLWQSPGQQTYEMLGSETGAQIQLRFVADARAADIGKLLAAEQLEIVSGPGAAGIYRLRLLQPATPGMLDELVARLAREDRIVAFVARE